MKKLITIALFTIIGVVAYQSTSAQCANGKSQAVLTVTTKSYASEIFWKVRNGNGSVVDSVQLGTYRNNSTYYDTLCLDLNTTYYFEAWDNWGDGWNGSTYSISSGNKLLINNGGKTPSDGTNQSGLTTRETSESFRISVDTLPDLAVTNIDIGNTTFCGLNQITVRASVKVVDTVSVNRLYLNYKLDTQVVQSEVFSFSGRLKQDSVVEIVFSTNTRPKKLWYAKP